MSTGQLNFLVIASREISVPPKGEVNLFLNLEIDIAIRH